MAFRYMDCFPSDVHFRASWRDYQARVLDDLKTHINDGRLHVVAAPGSGKTVLGLEVVRRLNRAALVLVPTLTIREQWVDRLANFFLSEPHVPDWVSIDVRRPGFLTVATYQALHTAMAGEEILSEEEEGNKNDTDAAHESDNEVSTDRGAAVISALRQADIRVLVVDEAHHLRSEWWRSLTTLVEQLNAPTIVALTATPPYDVHPIEWERYEQLCGPVDAEIPVPDLVARGDLCAHQDCVYFSAPTSEESLLLTDFRNNVDQFQRELLANLDFASAVAGHPWLQSPYEHLEEILVDAAYASSLVIYLNAAGYDAPDRLLDVLGVGRKRLPKADLEWLEILLTGCLYSDSEHYESARHLMQMLGRRLRAIGALEHRRVVLRKSTASSRLLTASINKLHGIRDIVRLESENIGSALRAVVLADFIRKNEMPQTQNEANEFQQLGVVPIFETLRRAQIRGIRLGILSGSLVVLPRSAIHALEIAAHSAGLKNEAVVVGNLPYCDEFITVSFQGTASHSMVRVVTRLFGEGEITVLVGTTSLLGEGWDAPSINCLILASGVGSYMLSNQMRGRAIRIDPHSPDKTSNVWHLVTVEPDWDPGEDYETLVRRFRSFVGVARNRRVIENGIERLEMGAPPFSRERIEQINNDMKKAASTRQTQSAAWKESLALGSRLVPTIEAGKEHLPRKMVFANTLTALCWQGAMLGIAVFQQIFRAAGRTAYSDSWTAVKAAAVVGALVAAPFMLRASWLFVRHGTLERSLREVGRALLEALLRAGIIQSSPDLSVHAAIVEEGRVQCWLNGGTSYEKSIFLNALRDILDPVENPRYLLVRKTRWLRIRREDFHAVPEILGRKKRHAAYFYRMWIRHVGQAELVYTRSFEGRRLLLRARARALAASFQSRAKRRSCWK